MSRNPDTQPFDNAREKIRSIYDVTNEQAAEKLAESTQNYVNTLDEYRLISTPQRMVLDDELASARKNWNTPPKNGAFLTNVKIRMNLALAKTKEWLAAKELKWKSYWLKKVAWTAFFSLIATFVMVPFFGAPISIGYLVTAAGLLLVAFSLLVKYKFLQDLSTLIGVLLAGYWYIHSVGGAFNPVEHVVLSTDPKDGYFALVKVVKDGDSVKEDCSFSPINSTLTCNVRAGHSTLGVKP